MMKKKGANLAFAFAIACMCAYIGCSYISSSYQDAYEEDRARLDELQSGMYKDEFSGTMKKEDLESNARANEENASNFARATWLSAALLVVGCAAFVLGVMRCPSRKARRRMFGELGMISLVSGAIFVSLACILAYNDGSAQRAIGDFLFSGLGLLALGVVSRYAQYGNARANRK